MIGLVRGLYRSRQPSMKSFRLFRAAGIGCSWLNTYNYINSISSWKHFSISLVSREPSPQPSQEPAHLTAAAVVDSHHLLRLLHGRGERLGCGRGEALDELY